MKSLQTSSPSLMPAVAAIRRTAGSLNGNAMEAAFHSLFLLRAETKVEGNASSCVPSKIFQVHRRAGELQAGKSDAGAPCADARDCTHRIASSSSRLFAAGRRQPACCTPPASGESPCLAGRRYSIRTFLLLVRARARHNGAGGRGPDTRHQVHQYCLHVMPADVLAWPGLCSAGASHWPDLHVGR